jgi:formylglycine-generating enzyme required for sulfatase activity
MKYYMRFWGVVILAAALTFTACDTGKKDNNNSLLLMLLPGGGVLSAGDKVTYTADGVWFTMAYVPGGKTFPTGTDDLGTPATVANAYWIGETEVTYELWQKVYIWATMGAVGTGAGLYTFACPGREGNDGTIGAAATNQEPVTSINWRDAMVWCNALTEWYNAQKGTSYTCAYYKDSGYSTPLRSVDAGSVTYPDPGGQDDPYVNADATGFRLLTSNEWELAARWRNDATNTVSGYSNPWFTKGNSASGATTYYNDNTNGSGEPGRTANDVVAVYNKYWDGDSWELIGVTGTAEVKSKINGANSLGLYDMSGNLWEWCYDWYPGSEGSTRVVRGGSWSGNAYDLQAGGVVPAYPESTYVAVGFRFVRTQ